MFGIKKRKVWVVAVDMGYGHLRAALPFKDIAQHGGILTANEYPGIPEGDKKIWQDSRNFYETISRFKKFPLLGDFVFALFDKFQEIKEFYPSNESIEAPTLQLKQVYRLFEKKHWGEHLISQLNKNPLPLLCTFFIPAYMAEFWGYEAPIYLVIPDTDVSRAWAPLHPKESRIVYCASTQRAAARLKRYGVRPKQVVVTGFPLPQEFTKNKAKKTKNALRRRLAVLDPQGVYRLRYGKVIEQYLDKTQSSTSACLKPGFKQSGFRRLVLTFAIGGAGAQADIAEDIMEGVKPLTKEGTFEFHIVAGIHRTIATALKQKAGKHIFVHYSANKKQYFQDFSKIISKTDILWTKPSELVFYAGLGIPIIMAPPIGSQEACNRKWLLGVGAGVDQQKPELIYQWLPDFIKEGVFAEAAMQGFVEIPKNGAENIIKLVTQS